MFKVKIHISLILLLVSFACERTQAPSATMANKQSSIAQPKAGLNVDSENPCIQFDKLNAFIRDGLVDKQAARAKIAEIFPKLKAYFYAKGGIDSPLEVWIFPLDGYSYRSIGGTNGSGYISNGYDYFDGNKHGGHPAHDIFIADRNQDGLDDNTLKPVNVVAMKSGVVVASAGEWVAGSELRGGKYIYVLEPITNSLIYYAHNREIFVMPGDVVTAGTVLATVGRTGKSANASRSPTHLHVMKLNFDDGQLNPDNLYQALLKARSAPKANL